MGPENTQLWLQSPLRSSREYQQAIPRSAHEADVCTSVGCVDEVQFMHDLRTLDQTAKPSTLRFSSSSEIEHHRNPLRQEGANVGRERVLQSGIALHKFRNAGDLAGIQRSQPIVLHEKKGAFPLGQLSGESGFSCRHFPADENQLR